MKRTFTKKSFTDLKKEQINKILTPNQLEFVIGGPGDRGTVSPDHYPH